MRGWRMRTAVMLAFGALAGAARGDELEGLRAENARLRSELDAARQACPAAAASPANAAAAALPTPALAATPPAPPAAPAPAAAAPPAAVVPAAPATAVAAPPPSVTPPRGYHLAPDVVPDEKARYARTGCDHGFFGGEAPGKWRDADAWKPMHAGMSMEEVEATLGVEHYDVDHGGVLEWHYGQCGYTAEAMVRFNAGRVDGWHAPD